MDENIFDVKDEMTETMFKKFGIFRKGQTMEEGLKEILKMENKFSDLTLNNKDLAVNQTLVQFLEIEGMLKIAEVVARSAIKREESRGSHMRTDHPNRDDENYLKHTLIVVKR